MRLEHVALWTADLERLRGFYEGHLGATAGPLYRSTNQVGFCSYFLTFPGGGARVELMTRPELQGPAGAPHAGYAHLALSVGSREAVDALTARLQAAGVPIASPPRQTGDGYYESVILDPDGNRVELTA